MPRGCRESQNDRLGLNVLGAVFLLLLSSWALCPIVAILTAAGIEAARIAWLAIIASGLSVLGIIAFACVVESRE